jgi:hypothetical protein
MCWIQNKEINQYRTGACCMYSCANAGWITPDNTASPLAQISRFLNAVMQAPYSLQCIYTRLLLLRFFFYRPSMRSYDTTMLCYEVADHDMQAWCCKSRTN